MGRRHPRRCRRMTRVRECERAQSVPCAPKCAERQPHERLGHIDELHRQRVAFAGAAGLDSASSVRPAHAIAARVPSSTSSVPLEYPSTPLLPSAMRTPSHAIMCAPRKERESGESGESGGSGGGRAGGGTRRSEGPTSAPALSEAAGGGRSLTSVQHRHRPLLLLLQCDARAAASPFRIAAQRTQQSAPLRRARAWQCIRTQRPIARPFMHVP